MSSTNTMQELELQPTPNPKTITSKSEMTQNEVEEQLQCPRCCSKNTKFGYYNNQKITQPRHYCKNCHRHWTKGGTLRNIPIGGSRRISSKRAISKKVISKPPTSPATPSSVTVVELPLNPVPIQSEMPFVPVYCDYPGCVGNFNVGWPYMRSSGESGSNGSNERFNGDLNMLFHDLW